MKLTDKQGNLILGGAAIVTGLVILFLTRMQGLEFVRKSMPGAGMFPTLCAIGVAVCGALLIFEVLSAQKKAGNESGQEDNLINPYELRNLTFFMVLGGMILALSNYIGLLTCLFLSNVLYIRFQGKDSWRKAVVIGVGSTVFLYLVFALFLRVPLPKGPLGF